MNGFALSIHVGKFLARSLFWLEPGESGGMTVGGILNYDLNSLVFAPNSRDIDDEGRSDVGVGGQNFPAEVLTLLVAYTVNVKATDVECNAIDTIALGHHVEVLLSLDARTVEVDGDVHMKVLGLNLVDVSVSARILKSIGG